MTRPSRWVAQRLLIAVPVVVGITVLTFTLIHLAPGDPLTLLAGDGGSPSYYADMRAKYGLDRSLPEQLVRYAKAVAKGDFGYSFTYQEPVARVLVDHIPASLLLGITALALATLVGFSSGVLSALLPSRALDVMIRASASVLYAAPVFWTGQVLMLLLALKLGVLPVGGMNTARETLTGVRYAADVARHLVLPAVTLSLPFMAVVARVSRASLLEAAREPFVRASYARGFSSARVVVRHVAPNALVPIVALVGEHAAQLAAGAALTEALFGWPGLGYLVLHASLHRDYPLVTAAFILIGSAVVVVNALSDALCAWLDPRIPLA